jgi:hypothetical protein
MAIFHHRIVVVMFTNNIKAIKVMVAIDEHGQLLPFKIDISFYSAFPQRVSMFIEYKIYQ